MPVFSFFKEIRKYGQPSSPMPSTCNMKLKYLILEFTSPMSIENFLQAFRKFISQREKPSTINCDNGSNFIEVENLLQKVDWVIIPQYGEAQKIIWKFNPPSAQW